MSKPDISRTHPRAVPDNPAHKKVRKLTRDPVAFVKDSKAYTGTRKTLKATIASLSSIVILATASILMVFYYISIASDRYVSLTQFVVEQSGSNEFQLGGLAALGGSSPALRDAQILKSYIESRQMAIALDQAVSLKAHYKRHDWDYFSRLHEEASTEAYVRYYQKHTTVIHDEISDIISVEVQTFEPEYSERVAQTILRLSERFINNLGDKMVADQVKYAEQDVTRTYQHLQESQSRLIQFQNDFELFSPEQQSSSLLTVIAQLEADIVQQEADLKSLLAFMRSSAPEVNAKQIRIDALRKQLAEEKSKLTNTDRESINKITVNYQEIKLNAELASQFYTASLAGLESVRADAFKELKHLLIIEHPAIAEEGKYPRRLYSIVTWFVILILIFSIYKLIIAIVNEHKG